MIKNDYQFALEFRTTKGRALAQRPVEANWEPASEWLRFDLWRKGQRPEDAAGAEAAIEPVNGEGAAAPYASGFRVTLAREGRRVGSCEFPLTYFGPQAREASAVLVKQGALTEGERFNYRLMAYPRLETAAKGGAAAAFTVSEVLTPPPLQPSSFRELAAGAVPFGDVLAGDVPVFLPQQVMEEVAEITEQAGAIETGGILIGRLCRDASLPEIGLVVAAQIPARHARGELHQLTFTAETWAAVQAALALRRTDELMLGWWHSHPAKFWCSPQCPPERRRECPLTRNFFSEDDVCLHESVFSKAFHIALVATNTDDGKKHALFGWREGMVRQRGFHILKTSRPLTAVAAAPNEENPNATPCDE